MGRSFSKLPLIMFDISVPLNKPATRNSPECGAGQINVQVVWTLYDTSPPLAVSFSSVLGMVINVDP